MHNKTVEGLNNFLRRNNAIGSYKPAHIQICPRNLVVEQIEQEYHHSRSNSILVRAVMIAERVEYQGVDYNGVSRHCRITIEELS